MNIVQWLKVGRYYEGKNTDKSIIIFKVLKENGNEVMIEILRDDDIDHKRFSVHHQLWIWNDSSLLSCFKNAKEVVNNERLVTLLL